MQARISSKWVAPVALAGAAIMASLPSCNSTTAGREVTFRAALAGGTSEHAPTTSAFVTYAGWSVTLSQAVVAVGPLYLYEGAPQASRLGRFFGVRNAHACPTHAQYDQGAVLGEILEQSVVDLLGAPTQLGEIMGVAGTCRTVELHLHPPGELPQGPSSTDVGRLQGHSMLLAGTATREDATVPFVARLTLPDEGLMRIVESIAAEVELDDADRRPGTLLVEPLLDCWLASVEFDSLTELDGADYVFSEGTQAWNALVRGVRSRQSYRVSWRAP